MEFTGLGSSWQSNLVALSTNRTAFVLGMVGTNLVVSLGTTNIRAGTLAAATFSAGWTLSLEDTNGSERGLAALGNSGSGRAILRLLDSGRIAVSRIITSTNPWPTEGLSAYYPLNINATDRFGLAGAAYSGNGDFINLNGNRPISGVQNAFTVSAWFRANNANLGNIFVHRAPFRDVVLGKAQDGRVLWDVHDNTGLLHILQSQPLPFGQWIHAVGTYDGTTQRLFVDGALVASSQWTGIVDWDANYLGDGIAGQPSDTSYRFDGTIDDLRIYTRALSGSELTLIRAGLFSGTIEEPASDDRLLWRGTSLALGSLRSSLGNSVLYTFGEDLNQNGALDFGDNFLTAEFLVTGSNSTLLTLSTQRVATATGQGYGLVALNFLNQSNEVFFTGEPDGQVFAWSATGSTNPLQRQLFSGQYAGQAWHAMAAVKTLKSGEGLLGLLVNPATPNKCEVILWPPQSQLPQAASFPQTAPLARVMPNPANGGNMANVTVRIWDAEGNASLPLLQFSPDTTNWFDVTNILTVGGVTYSLATRVPALPGGSSHTLVWNAGAIFPPGVTNIFLRTRAKDITLLGDWSEPMPYQLTLTLDSDGDGLPDDWEIGAFGNIAAQNGDGDADGDGFKNSFEHLAGTNPTDASSSLKLRIEPLVGAVKLSWPGGSNAAQVLQRTWAVPLGWQDVFTNPASTPGGFTNAITATNYFFQLRLQP